jgi:Mn-containing catalase
MRHDGTWDAHYLNEKGELIYDFTKDQRFNLLAEGKTDDPEYRN